MGPFAAECCMAVSASSAHSEASGPPSNSNQVQLAFPPYGPRHHLGNWGYFRPFCCSLCWDGKDLEALCIPLFMSFYLFPDLCCVLRARRGSRWKAIVSHLEHSRLSWLLSLFSGLLSSAYRLHRVVRARWPPIPSLAILRAPCTLQGKVQTPGRLLSCPQIWPQPVPPPSLPSAPEILRAAHQQYSSFCLVTCRSMLKSNSFRR